MKNFCSTWLKSKLILAPTVILITTTTVISIMCACTSEPQHLPNEGKYEEYTTLMLNVAGKFSEETNAKKLHGAAVSTQTVRLITCSDFKDECTLYGKFISLAIQTSADGNITPSERTEMRAHLAELRSAITTGKKLLREAWTKKK